MALLLLGMFLVLLLASITLGKSSQPSPVVARSPLGCIHPCVPYPKALLCFSPATTEEL